MAASLPASEAHSRPGRWPAAARRAEERGLDWASEAGSHLPRDL